MSQNSTNAGPLPGTLHLVDLTVPELLRVFKLLADETRLLILVRLIQAGEQHVRSLCEHLQQGQPAVSHHLALLRQAGLIACRRSGKHNYYRLSSPWLRTMLEAWTHPAATLERVAEPTDDRDDAHAAEAMELLV